MENLNIKLPELTPIEETMRNSASMLLSLNSKYGGFNKIPYAVLDAVEGAARARIGGNIDIVASRHILGVRIDKTVEEFDLPRLQELRQHRRNKLKQHALPRPIFRIDVGTNPTKNDSTITSWISIVDNPAINFQIVKFYDIAKAPTTLTSTIRKKTQTHTLTACADVIIEGRLRTVKMPTAVFETTIPFARAKSHPLEYMERIAINYAMLFNLEYGTEIDVNDDKIFIRKGKYFAEDMVLSRDHFPHHAISSLYVEDSESMSWPIEVDGVMTYAPEQALTQFVESFIQRNRTLITPVADNINKVNKGFISQLYMAEIKFNTDGEIFCNSMSMARAFGFTYSRHVEFKHLPLLSSSLIKAVEGKIIANYDVVTFPVIKDSRGNPTQLKLKQGLKRC